MDNIKFNQTGGFPLSDDILDTVQKEGQRAGAALAGLIGEDRFINTPEQTTDTAIGANLVVLNGELLPFIESDAANPEDFPDNWVGVFEETESREFEDLSTKEVKVIRYAKFGTSAIYQRKFGELNGWQRNIKWIIDNAIAGINKKLSVFTAGGAMVLWNKPAAQIPPGWQEVINWRGRIPVGMDITQTEFNEMGKMGGAKSITLQSGQLPEHNHGVKIAYSSSDLDVGGGSGPSSWMTNHPTGIQTYETEQRGQPVNILNPFRTVLFIEYVG